MALHEVLILAMTRMRSGICTAGFINAPHPDRSLRWVRPVKEFGTLLGGDMSLEMHTHLQAEAIYLSIGLSRSFEGKIWPLIIGVYPLPDYAACIDYNQP